MAIATGQISIIDYNDALSLTGFIGSNHPKTQMFNPDNNSYNPNWPTSNLVLTPTLFILGTTTDIITTTNVTSVTWCYNNNGTETGVTADANHVFSGTKSHVLTIKSNDLAGITGRDWICKVIYHDPSTNLDLTYKMGISFNRVINGSGIADAVAYCPDGNIFKNGAVPTLRAQCDLWRGSIIDTSSVTYRWCKQDSAVFASTTTAASSTTTAVICTSVTGMVVGSNVIVGAETARTITAINTGTKTITLGTALTAAPAAGVTVKHANYDADAGAGWALVASDSAGNITGVTTNTVTVYNAFVANYAVFLCLIKDTDSASATYNSVFKDTVAIVDQSDTIQISIHSTGGDVFKNGVGSTILTAKVFRAGAEIDSVGSAYTYKWYNYDKDSVLNANFGGAGISYKTGKTLSVGDGDVVVKGTFVVEIE